MIRLETAAFDPASELAAFSAHRTESGGIVSFLGLARGEAGAPALELQAYPAFTLDRISAFVDAAKTRFDLHDVAVIHRTGVILGGEPIVLVLTAAAHRRAAFEACDYLMDYLKSRVPLWKKALDDGEGRWIEPTANDLADLSRWE